MFIKDLYDSDAKRITEDRGPTFRKANVGWPSEALVSLPHFNVGTCQRGLFYRAIGVPTTNPMNVRIRRICDSGIAHEDLAIQKFKAMDTYLADQSRIEYVMPGTTNKVIMSGKIDVIIRDADGLKIGIEIKTVAGYGADMVFGRKNHPELPKANNLMQAMMYKFHSINNLVAGHKLDKVFLMYIDRSDSTTMFYEIDLDSVGYPIITPHYMDGTQGVRIIMANMQSYDDLINTGIAATSQQSSISELRINIHEVFHKFDDTYSYIRQEVLPPKDYALEFSDDEATKQYNAGRMTKLKYEKHRGLTMKGNPTKNIVKAGDFACAYCSHQQKCLEDSGIRLN